MHYAGIQIDDVGNGKGVRTSLFVSGCELHCSGCFNSEAWNPTYGNEFTKETLDFLLNTIDKDYCSGLSLLGGDPLAPYNIDTTIIIIKEFRKRFGWTKSIWMWTGYTIEEIMNDKLGRMQAIRGIDILIDGPFNIKKKDLSLKYRGSSNQRIIDVQNTLQFNTLITIE